MSAADRIWIAYNGYMGYGPVACIVRAATEEEAREGALAAFAAAEPKNPDYARIEEIMELELPYVGDTL